MDDVRKLVAGTPCGDAVMAALGQASGVFVVGGFVRDRLLGRDPHEIDIATTGDAALVAGNLGEVTEQHERFGTARALAGDCRFDVARTRIETYPAPGALPDVSFTDDIAADLRRRDFTVNAMAIDLANDALVEFPGARADLIGRVLRVLHDDSFRDDPTRLWRMIRYAVRLGLRIDPHTQELAQAAIASGALATVSGDRIGNELRLAITEPDPLATLHAAANAGIAPLAIDPALVTAALQTASPEARGDLIILACCLTDDTWVSGLGLSAGELDVIRRCIKVEPAPSGPPSVIAAALRGLPPEAAAVAGARGDRASAELWLLRLRFVDLEIDGDDLLAAGVASGPEIGRRLARALDAKLDGMVSGRDDELAEALR